MYTLSLVYNAIPLKTSDRTYERELHQLMLRFYHMKSCFLLHIYHDSWERIKFKKKIKKPYVT